ncbi:MAG: T9SS type A sorting domain-containing protein [Bacteroidales bacterium]|nr:T9SS type A sorting domain-containing protein [Bacteroidales bacterium]
MLKNIKVILFILAFWALFVPFCGAQTTIVDVHLNGGDTQSFEIADNGKLYFQNDYLFIEDGLNLPYSLPVSSIQKMNFSYIAGIQEIDAAGYKLYPNPASSFLKIFSQDNDLNHYQIFSSDGRMVLEGISRNDEPVDIHTLAKGLYMVKVNDKTFKITKL